MLVQFGRFPVHESLADTLVDDLFGSFLTGRRDVEPARLLPLDVAENANELVVIAELPGVKRDQIKVTLQDGVLTVAGEKPLPGMPDDGRRHRAERVSGRFSRSLELPAAVDSSAVSAELKDGILRIVIPKAEEARPREIRVN